MSPLARLPIHPPYHFASHSLPLSQIFYSSPLSLAIVNLKPLVPGHVLVIPKRVVSRMRDLNDAEMNDIWKVVKEVSGVIERVYQGRKADPCFPPASSFVYFLSRSMTIACQDGPYAGQSIPHVHIHLIPRKPLDYEPLDEVYTALDEIDLSTEYEEVAMRRIKRSERKKSQVQGGMDVEGERKARSPEEMETEARSLRSHFGQGNIEGLDEVLELSREGTDNVKD